MQRIFRTLLFWTLVLCACSTGTSSPPVIDERCAYQWAYQDMPELSKQLQEEIMPLNAEATAWGTAFGEDCVYADGHADFSAMETDFYVHLPIADLTDYGSFGNWISQVMAVVEELPSDLIVGSQAGFVEFKFTKSDTEFLFVRVPIQQFRETASGKTGEELFRMFYTEP